MDTLTVLIVIAVVAFVAWFFFRDFIETGLAKLDILHQTPKSGTAQGPTPGTANPNTGVATLTQLAGAIKGVGYRAQVSMTEPSQATSIEDVIPRSQVQTAIGATSSMTSSLAPTLRARLSTISGKLSLPMIQ